MKKKNPLPLKKKQIKILQIYNIQGWKPQLKKKKKTFRFIIDKPIYTLNLNYKIKYNIFSIHTLQFNLFKAF